jgi:peptidoglycan/LPS O-acetylase OafA/YrhL
VNIETARPRLSELTSLRFFAALHVVFFHALAMRIITGDGWLQRTASIGYVGVGLFFVLSGFILVYTYAGSPIKVAGFWRARFARVYPAYLFSLLLVAPFFFYSVTHLHIPFFEWATRHLQLASALPLLLLQAWVPQGAMSWNPVAWSLSVEALFYLLFPFLLPLLAKRTRAALFLVVGLCWTCTLGITGWYSWSNPDHLLHAGPTDENSFWLNVMKFFPLMRLPEFILGMAAGLIFLKSKTLVKMATPLVAAGLLAGGLAAAYSQHIPFAILHTALLPPAFAAIVYGLALQPSWLRFLRWSPLVLLGDASYSLYLLHSTIMGMYFLGNSGQPRHMTVGGIALGIALIIGSAVLVFKLIEEPARRKLRGKTLLRKRGAQAELVADTPPAAV